MKDLNKLFHKINSTISLSEPSWSDFKEYWTPKEFLKGEQLCSKGQIEKYLYFIIEGAVKAYHSTEEKDICVAFGFDGRIICSAESFIAQAPSIYVTEAVSDVKTLRISYTDLQTCYDNHHDIERWGRILAENIALLKQYREVSLITFDAGQRLKRLQTNSPEVFQYFSLKDIASYLGMSPETLSRLRNEKNSLS